MHVDPLGSCVGFLKGKKLLKFGELLLEAHIREYDGATLTSELESLLKLHIFLLHQIGDDARGASRNTGITVDEHATARHTLLDE